MMKCLIVDDEELATKVIQNHISQIDGLEKKIQTDSERIAYARIFGDLATAMADEARRDAQSIDTSKAEEEQIEDLVDKIESDLASLALQAANEDAGVA